MSNYTLNLKISGGNIESDMCLLTADSVEYIIASFSFDDSWNELLKTAIFRVGELVYHSPLENDACKIPFEALKEPVMYISVFGVLGTTRATTNELAIQIQNSGYVTCEPKAPTPDPYNYFLEEVTKLKDETANNTSLTLDAAKNVENDVKIITDLVDIASSAESNALSHSQWAEEKAKEAGETLLLTQEVADNISSMKLEVENNSATAAKAADDAQTAVLTGIETHNADENSLAHPNIMEVAQTAKSIALGKANSLCFDTEEQLRAWVAGSFERLDGKTTDNLKIGDNLYILELGVPDYWWDGSNIQPLGAEKPDFSDYYTKSQIDARLSDTKFDLISRTDYNALNTAGNLEAGRIYFVFEG